MSKKKSPPSLPGKKPGKKKVVAKGEGKGLLDLKGAIPTKQQVEEVKDKKKQLLILPEEDTKWKVVDEFYASVDLQDFGRTLARYYTNQAEINLDTTEGSGALSLVSDFISSVEDTDWLYTFLLNAGIFKILTAFQPNDVDLVKQLLNYHTPSFPNFVRAVYAVYQEEVEVDVGVARVTAEIHPSGSEAERVAWGLPDNGGLNPLVTEFNGKEDYFLAGIGFQQEFIDKILGFMMYLLPVGVTIEVQVSA